jgi:hypothetical protein
MYFPAILRQTAYKWSKIKNGHWIMPMSVFIISHAHYLRVTFARIT